jgi:hypothetical protein
MEKLPETLIVPTGSPQDKAQAFFKSSELTEFAELLKSNGSHPLEVLGKPEFTEFIAVLRSSFPNPEKGTPIPVHVPKKPISQKDYEAEMADLRKRLTETGILAERIRYFLDRAMTSTNGDLTEGSDEKINAVRLWSKGF